ncbi:MAG: helix-turn-helix transcriptional regulator [Bacteroidales bacterium]|nr:helix-turn-helix transcriptional regulator [Bacteroidales bacterium]
MANNASPVMHDNAPTDNFVRSTSLATPGYSISPTLGNLEQEQEISISRREEQVLSLLGKGMVAKQIADKLNISTTTVISHKKKLINKFRVKNSVELIKCASRYLLL